MKIRNRVRLTAASLCLALAPLASTAETIEVNSLIAGGEVDITIAGLPGCKARFDGVDVSADVVEFKFFEYTGGICFEPTDPAEFKFSEFNVPGGFEFASTVTVQASYRLDNGESSIVASTSTQNASVSDQARRIAVIQQRQESAQRFDIYDLESDQYLGFEHVGCFNRKSMEVGNPILADRSNFRMYSYLNCVDFDFNGPQIVIFDLATQKAAQPIAVEQRIRDLAIIEPAGTLLVLTGDDDSAAVRMIDPFTRVELASFSVSTDTKHISLAADGLSVVLGEESGVLWRMDLASQIQTFVGRVPSPIVDVLDDPRRRWVSVLTLVPEGPLTLYRVGAQTIPLTLAATATELGGTALSTNGNFLSVGWLANPRVSHISPLNLPAFPFSGRFHVGRLERVETEFLGDAPALSWERDKVVALSSKNGEILFGDDRFQVGGTFFVSGEFISGPLNGAQ